jgi:hypothetical protein
MAWAALMQHRGETYAVGSFTMRETASGTGDALEREGLGTCIGTVSLESLPTYKKELAER